MSKKHYQDIVKRLLRTCFICFLMLGIINVIWSVQRKIILKNHTLLMQYEKTEPHIIPSESAALFYYEYELEEGTVTLLVSEVDDTIKNVIVHDKKRGFLKQYDGKVLRFTWDFKTEAIYEFFSFPYITQKEIHTAQECEQLNRLLNEMKYEEINNVWKADIVTTTGNTLFIE